MLSENFFFNDDNSMLFLFIEQWPLVITDSKSTFRYNQWEIFI